MTSARHAIPAEWIRLSATYHIDPDASSDSLFDDANELLDHTRSIALTLCHSLTEHAQIDIHHISSTFAAIANLIDMVRIPMIVISVSGERDQSSRGCCAIKRL